MNPSRLLARLNIDPYLLLLIGTVGLASVLPARGAWAEIADRVTDAAIVLLFFLHGARLSREAILDGVRAWKLHLTTLALTFLAFPLIGLGVRAIPGLDPSLATGVLFLTLLPSTVQSSIAFTAVARGNVAAAVCSASFSNLAGVFVTPLLTALLVTGRHGGFSADPVITIASQLLLPFVAGHALRPWIGGFVAKHRKVLGYTDRTSILLVVYTAFGAAVVEGLWSRVSASDLLLIAAISLAVLGLIMATATLAGKALGFAREDRVVLLFCGSKKSLATGVPLAGVLFAPAQIGAVILPLMIFHQIQLMVCAMLARRFAQQAQASAQEQPTAQAPA